MSNLLINDLESNPSGGMIKISKEMQRSLLGGYDPDSFALFGFPDQPILPSLPNL
jgi:hypothetical protein